MKKILISAGILIAIIIAIWLTKSPAVKPLPSPDYQNISYKIEGESITLKNGVAITEITPDSVTKKTTRYFGNSSEGDLDEDGKTDIGIILTQDAGGSGKFYYIAVAIKTEAGYKGSNAILLGDRIAPQNTEIRSGYLIVNYAERAQGEPMTASPSIGKSKYLILKNDILSETPIFVESPEKNSTATSPLKITGVAKGSWFFEASLPLLLVDASGKIIAQSHATAQGEWMTTDYVRFSGTVKFPKPTQEMEARLILKKDNPSDLPEHDDQIEIPIRLK